MTVIYRNESMHFLVEVDKSPGFILRFYLN